MLEANVTMAIVSLLLGCAAFGAVVYAGCRKKGTAGVSPVGGCIWLMLLAVWVVLEAAGVVSCGNPGFPMLAAILLGCTAAVFFMGPRYRTEHRKVLMALHPLVVLLCIPVAFFLLEWPYNDLLFAMDAAIARLNLALVGSGLVAAWFLGQRRSGAVTAYLGVCLGFGLANYFVCLFKEQTILPADLLAIGTAAEVSAGYTYELHESAVAALCVFFAAAALLCLMPSVRLTRKRIAFNVVAGLLCVALPVSWYHDHDIEKDYGVKVDVWSTRESYQEFGSVLSFLQRVQEVEPSVPVGYSTEAADELQDSLARAWDRTHPGYPATLEEARRFQKERTGSEELPTVIAIMNESFSDLSTYPGIENYAGLPAFDAIDAIGRGELFTSVRGGGTCNSEFEYLTGTTLGSLGGGVYPYMFYDLENVESLPKYFSSLGYDTTAIHPAAASNWRRDVVYLQLGFDDFLSEASMPVGAQTLRDLITDRVTYDAILDLLKTSEDPQFIFDVTLQNHGGYDTGLLDSYPYDGVTVNGEVIEGMSEYLSCVDASQDDLLYLLDQLKKLDRKVVVVFFGDHQPGFNDQIAEAAYGVEVGELTLEQVQQRFETPYFIWANYDGAGEGEGDVGGAPVRADMSAGYLMAQTAYAAGLPLTDFQKALLQLSTEIPAVNLNGYQGADGTWYWASQDGPARKAFEDYAFLQYADLFDAKGNSAFDAFVEGRRGGEARAGEE